MNPKDIVIRFLLEAASRDPRIDSLILFGSRARGNSTDRSDYDVAVHAPAWTSADWARWKLAVEEEVPSLCGLDVVWVTDQTPSNLLDEIQKSGIKFYEKK